MDTFEYFDVHDVAEYAGEFKVHVRVVLLGSNIARGSLSGLAADTDKVRGKSRCAIPHPAAARKSNELELNI